MANTEEDHLGTVRTKDETEHCALYTVQLTARKPTFRGVWTPEASPLARRLIKLDTTLLHFLTQ